MLDCSTGKLQEKEINSFRILGLGNHNVIIVDQLSVFVLDVTQVNFDWLLISWLHIACYA